MFVTWDVFQLPMGSLKALAPKNIWDMDMTFSTSQHLTSEQVLMEWFIILLHQTHRVPVANVFVEGMCIAKHLRHVRHTGRDPLAIFGIDFLIENHSSAKHLRHVRHTGRVPVANVFVEFVRIAKHLRHVRHTGRDPLAIFGIDFLIENHSSAKHLRHVRHTGRVPVANVFVEFVRIVKHL
jgi:hypothetical protein